MRLRRTLTAAVAALTLTAVQQLPAAASAPHVTGLVRTISYGTGVTRGPSTTRAYCPDGKRVISGGGGVWRDKFTSPDQVVLSAMQPVHPLSGDDFYRTHPLVRPSTRDGLAVIPAVLVVARPTSPAPARSAGFRRHRAGAFNTPQLAQRHSVCRSLRVAPGRSPAQAVTPSVRSWPAWKVGHAWVVGVETR